MLINLIQTPLGCVCVCVVISLLIIALKCAIPLDPSCVLYTTDRTVRVQGALWCARARRQINLPLEKNTLNCNLINVVIVIDTEILYCTRNANVVPPPPVQHPPQ